MKQELTQLVESIRGVRYYRCNNGVRSLTGWRFPKVVVAFPTRALFVKNNPAAFFRRHGW